MKKETGFWTGLLVFGTIVITSCFVSVYFNTSTWVNMYIYKFLMAIGF